MYIQAIIFAVVGIGIISQEPKATPYLIAASMIYGTFLFIRATNKMRPSGDQQASLDMRAEIQEDEQWKTTKSALLEIGEITDAEIETMEWDIVEKIHEDWLAFEQTVKRKATPQEYKEIVADAIMRIGIPPISPKLDKISKKKPTAERAQMRSKAHTNMDGYILNHRIWKPYHVTSSSSTEELVKEAAALSDTIIQKIYNRENDFSSGEEEQKFVDDIIWKHTTRGMGI